MPCKHLLLSIDCKGGGLREQTHLSVLTHVKNVVRLIQSDVYQDTWLRVPSWKVWRVFFLRNSVWASKKQNHFNHLRVHVLVCKQATSCFWKGVLLRSRDFIAIWFKANSSKGYAVPRFGYYLKDEGGLSLLWISQALCECCLHCAYLISYCLKDQKYCVCTSLVWWVFLGLFCVKRNMSKNNKKSVFLLQ